MFNHIPSRWGRNLLLVCLSVGFVSSTFAAERLQDIEEGRLLYADNCSECHGEEAPDYAAVGIAQKSFNDIIEAVEGVDDMEDLEISKRQIEAIAVYLSVQPKP